MTPWRNRFFYSFFIKRKEALQYLNKKTNKIVSRNKAKSNSNLLFGGGRNWIHSCWQNGEIKPRSSSVPTPSTRLSFSRRKAAPHGCGDKRSKKAHPAGRRESSTGGGDVVGASNFAFFVNRVLPVY